MISLLRPNYVPGDIGTRLLLFTQKRSPFMLIPLSSPPHSFPPPFLRFRPSPPSTLPQALSFPPSGNRHPIAFSFNSSDMHPQTFPSFQSSLSQPEPSAAVCVVTKWKRGRRAAENSVSLSDFLVPKEIKKRQKEGEREREKWFPLHWNSPPLIVHQSLAISQLQIEMKGTCFHLSLKTE